MEQLFTSRLYGYAHPTATSTQTYVLQEVHGEIRLGGKQSHGAAQAPFPTKRKAIHHSPGNDQSKKLQALAREQQVEHEHCKREQAHWKREEERWRMEVEHITRDNALRLEHEQERWRREMEQFTQFTQWNREQELWRHQERFRSDMQREYQHIQRDIQQAHERMRREDERMQRELQRHHVIHQQAGLMQHRHELVAMPVIPLIVPPPIQTVSLSRISHTTTQQMFSNFPQPVILQPPQWASCAPPTQRISQPIPPPMSPQARGIPSLPLEVFIHPLYCALRFT